MDYPITDRLRCKYNGRDFSGPMQVTLPTAIMLEAAEEIDRLAAENADMQQRLMMMDDAMGRTEAALQVAQGEVGSLHEELAAAYISVSGKRHHMNDCATSCAPAERPKRCDCDAPNTYLGLLVKQLRKGDHFTVESMASLMRELATALTAANSRMERLREALKRYGEHDAEYLETDCTCGLYQAKMADDAKEVGGGNF